MLDFLNLTDVMLGVVLHRNVSSKVKYLINVWPNLNRSNWKNE